MLPNSFEEIFKKRLPSTNSAYLAAVSLLNLALLFYEKKNVQSSQIMRLKVKVFDRSTVKAIREGKFTLILFFKSPGL